MFDIFLESLYIWGRNGFDGGQDGLSSEQSCRQLLKKVEKL